MELFIAVTEENYSRKQILKNLLEDIRQTRPLTGKGFFEINRSTLTSMLGIIGTYLVIMLQSR